MRMDRLFSSFPFIAGENVSLTRMTELDLRDLWAIVGDEENYRLLPTAALTSSSQCIRKLRQADALFRDRRALVFGIYPTQGAHRLVGTLEVLQIDPQVESVTISFVISRRDREQHYASGAVRAVSKYLLEQAQVHRIQATLLPANTRAALVLERCGYQKEGTLREAVLWPDKGRVDLTVYSLLPADLAGRRKQILF